MARERKQPSSGIGMIPEPQPVQAEADGKVTLQTLSYLYAVLLGIVKAINGFLSMGDGSHGSWTGNLDAQYKDVLTPAVADTEFTVFHELGRLPVGYHVVRRDKAGTVYDSSAASWGEDKLFLKCSATSVSIKLLIW